MTDEQIERYTVITKKVPIFGDNYKQSDGFKKQKRNAKKMNVLRRKAIYERGYKLETIYPLSLEKLEGLLNGSYRFNEYEELEKV